MGFYLVRFHSKSEFVKTANYYQKNDINTPIDQISLLSNKMILIYCNNILFTLEIEKYSKNKLRH